MTDIMLDIETLGLDAGAIPLSVGACVFDRNTGEITSEFYIPINAADAERAGLRAEAGTVMWWMQQSEAARTAITFGKTLRLAAERFFDWFWAHDMEASTIWAQGDMDFRVWGAAMDAVKIERPWRFWAQRDTRTVYDVCGFDAKSFPRDGTYHNALDDARHQVACLHAALKHGGLAE